MNLLKRLDIFLVAIGVSLFLAWFALHRVVALDGGFYLYAAKLVGQGQLPYLDFFYPQMPVLPYFYALWGALITLSWESARVLSALCAAVALLLLYSYAKSQGRILSALLVLTILSANYFYPWMTIVKSYSLTFLTLTAALFLFFRQRTSRLGDLCAGLLFALSVQSRLYVIAALIVFALWPACDGIKTAVRRMTYFSLGFFICFAPTMYLAGLDWGAFLYNNIGYHLERTAVTPSEEPMIQRTKILSILLGIRPSAEHPGLLFPALILGSLLHVARRFMLRSLPDPFVAAAIVLFVVSLVPTPVYLQYFCLVLPGFVLGSWLFLAENVNARWIRFGIPLVLLLHNLYYLPSDIERYTESGEAVIGIRSREQAATWSIRSIREVSETIDAYTEPGEEVLANWEGFFVESHAKPLLGTENRFGVLIAKHMGALSRQKLRVVAPYEIKNLVAKGAVRVAVTGKRKGPSLRAEELEALGFTEVRRIGLNSVYVATPGTR
ncbi:MAG: hypothetical protein QY326_04030 [Bdellovibrionota bacterium]|nr:MAG: hypothetical protein QY326_04030 [Bdellovibrionota bacterium]